MDLTWFANTRADTISRGPAALMRAAGCHQLFMGAESGAPQLLKYVRKGESPAQMLRGAQAIREAGIALSCGFIIGLPGETEDTVRATVRLARQLRPDRVQFSRWTPLAGSELVSHRDRFQPHPRTAILPGSAAQQRTLDGGERRGMSGFHGAGAVADQVDEWIAHCYRSCEAERTGRTPWGLPSL